MCCIVIRVKIGLLSPWRLICWLPCRRPSWMRNSRVTDTLFIFLRSSSDWLQKICLLEDTFKIHQGTRYIILAVTSEVKKIPATQMWWYSSPDEQVEPWTMSYVGVLGPMMSKLQPCLYHVKKVLLKENSGITGRS